MDKAKKEAMKLMLSTPWLLEAFQEASALVGLDVAHDMLCFRLLKENGSQEKVEKKLSELKKEGFFLRIAFSPLAGKGILQNEEGVALSILDANDMYKPRKINGTDVPKMISSWKDRIDIPAGPYPFEGAFQKMKRLYIYAQKKVLEGTRSVNG